MENISFSENKKGWLAGEEVIEQKEEVVGPLITKEEVLDSYEHLSNLMSSYYKQQKSKEVSDSIIYLEQIKRLIDN